MLISWLLVCAGVAILVVPLASKQLESIRYASVWKRDLSIDPARRFAIDAKPLGDLLVFDDNEGNRDRAYADKVNEGLAMLRRVIAADDRILVLEFSNPFSFGLLQRSPLGDSVVYDYDRNFDQAHHWPAEKLFRDVSVVMVSKQVDYPTTKALWDLYGEHVERHFAAKLTGDRWVLYDRKKGDRP